MKKQVIHTEKLPEIAQILAERIAARTPTIDPADYDIRVSMWGKYIDIELAKDSIQNYASVHDNVRACSVGTRDLSYSEIITTNDEASRLYDIANERKFAIVIADRANMAYIFLSNLAEPASTSKEQIIELLRAWDKGWA